MKMMTNLVVLFLFGITIIGCDQKDINSSEEGITKSLFKAIEKRLDDKIVNLMISDEIKNEIIDEFKPESDKGERVVKKLKKTNVGELTRGFEKKFKEISAQLDGKKISYGGIMESDLQFDLNTLKIYITDFKISLDDRYYKISLDLIKFKDKFYALDINHKVIELIAMEFTKPLANPIVINEGETFDIEVKFDAKKANEKRAWLETVYDGKQSGFVAGDLESPVRDELPTKILTKGKHTLSYKLHPSGANTTNPFNVISLDIEVK